MKKYFGNKKNWTIEELKNVVANNPQLGFYLPIEIEKNRIIIHNRNNGYNGSHSKYFLLQEDKTYLTT
jgi:hypothetical protein